MRSFYLLATLVCVGITSLSAQTRYEWFTEQQPNCDSTGTVTHVTYGSKWTTATPGVSQRACVSGDMPNASTWSLDLTGHNTATSLSMTASVASSPGIPLPPGQQAVSISADLPASLLRPDQTLSVYLASVDTGGTQTGLNRIFVYPNGTTSFCPSFYTGSRSLHIIAIIVPLADSTSRPQQFDLGFEVTVTPFTGTVLTGIQVPPSDFTGTEYVHQLPAGNLLLRKDPSGLFEVGLVDNQPTAQDIVLRKRGGSVSSKTLTPVVQRSTQTDEPHRISFDLDSVSLCLNGELFLVDQQVLRVGSISPDYSSRQSCLSVGAGSQLVVKAGATAHFGREGFGMQLMAFDGATRVEEDATLVLDGGLVNGDSLGNLHLLELGERAQLLVTAESWAGSSAQAQSIRVVAPASATIDLSQASLEVQQLFVIEQTSSTAQATTAEPAVRVGPIPTASGWVSLSASSSSVKLAAVDIYTLDGRQVSSHTFGAGASSVRLFLDRPGQYLLAATLTDGSRSITRAVRL